MGSVYLTDLADVLRLQGLNVREYDSNWQYRGRSAGGYEPGRPTHLMIHHTASPPGASGYDDAHYCTEVDEDAPLCNLYLDQSGMWWVCAGGATNCNGKGSDWWDGGVPDDSMNSYALAIEANGGYGADWPKVQQDSYVTGTAALAAHYGIPNNNIRGHFEWAPDRKVDPSGPSKWSDDQSSWDMGWFRLDVQNMTGGGESEEDMPLSDEDVQRVAKAVWSYLIGDPPDEDKPASWRLRQIHGMARYYLGGWNDDWENPEKTLLKKIDENTR